MKEGLINAEAKDDQAQSVYETYYHFSQSISKMAGHRTLALNRGESEKVLTVKVEAPEAEILSYLESRVISKENRCV